MKNWLKKQATEFTAIIGFALILSAFFAPDWWFLTIGVLLIAIDDDKAKAWTAKVAPGVGRWLDEVGK